MLFYLTAAVSERTSYEWISLFPLIQFGNVVIDISKHPSSKHHTTQHFTLKKSIFVSVDRQTAGVTANHLMVLFWFSVTWVMIALTNDKTSKERERCYEWLRKMEQEWLPMKHYWHNHYSARLARNVKSHCKFLFICVICKNLQYYFFYLDICWKRFSNTLGYIQFRSCDRYFWATTLEMKCRRLSKNSNFALCALCTMYKYRFHWCEDMFETWRGNFYWISENNHRISKHSIRCWLKTSWFITKEITASNEPEIAKLSCSDIISWNQIM